MAEALRLVKQKLGPDAVILHTRTIRRGGVLGVGARAIVEITASRDPSVLPAAERRAMIGSRGGRSAGSYGRREGTSRHPAPQAEGAAMGRKARPNPDPGPSAREEVASFTAAMREEVGQLRSMVRELLERPDRAAPAPPSSEQDANQLDLPSELRDHYTSLLQNEVAEEIAREIIEKAQAGLREYKKFAAADNGEEDPSDADKLRQLVPPLLVETIAGMLPPAEPVQLGTRGSRKYVILVGPTGVGKTTTVAKLAAHFKLRENRNVGLITTDTYRIAAVDQLRAYAEILEVPLQVVLTPQEMSTALNALSDCDLVLVDTSGRSQRDSRRLEDLKAFITSVRQAAAEARTSSELQFKSGRRPLRGADGKFISRRHVESAGPDVELHLVLSCTANPSQLVEAAQRFGTLGVNRVVFTKLDEAVGLGVILNVVRRLNLQMSYLTTGQDVPEDIEVGHRRRIAELVLGRAGLGQASDEDVPDEAPAVDHVA